MFCLASLLGGVVSGRQVRYKLLIFTQSAYLIQAILKSETKLGEGVAVVCLIPGGLGFQIDSGILTGEKAAGGIHCSDDIYLYLYLIVVKADELP